MFSSHGNQSTDLPIDWFSYDKYIGPKLVNINLFVQNYGFLRKETTAIRVFVTCNLRFLNRCFAINFEVSFPIFSSNSTLCFRVFFRIWLRNFVCGFLSKVDYQVSFLTCYSKWKPHFRLIRKEKWGMVMKSLGRSHLSSVACFLIEQWWRQIPWVKKLIWAGNVTFT